MSQAEIYEYLKKHKGKKFTAIELAKKTGICKSAASVSMMKLMKDKSLKIKVEPSKWKPLFGRRANKYYI